VTGHRRHEEPIHRSFGSFEQAGRLGRVEAPSASCDRELLVERHAEAEETLDGLAERKTEGCGDTAVLSCVDCRLIQMVGGRFGPGRIEMLEEPRGQELAALAEEEALAIGEGQDPGQLRRGLTPRSAIRPGDLGGAQPGASERWPTGPICRKEALEGAPRKAAMATRGGEHPDTAGIAPAPKRGRRNTEEATGL